VAQVPIRIAMTAPVTERAAASGYTVQFTMPSGWTLETLPEPQDPRVVLHAVAARRVAVHRYSGGWSQARYRDHLARLQHALAAAGLTPHGEPVFARYDPPWQPWFWRRNEIWLELERAAPKP
jgi:hypothetical protein